MRPIYNDELYHFGIIAMKQKNKEREAGEDAVARWGTRILTYKVSDYSHIIPNVSYTVR